MADEELYRVKLVMEIHDRTRAALARMSSASRRVESAFARTRQVAQSLGRTVISPTVSIKDKATAGLQLVRSAAKSLTGTAWRLTLAVWDRATGFLDRIRRSLFSLKGLAVTVLAGLGLGKLGQATLGAAATWETQAVSMEHFLRGNKALAAEITGWLERFAAATPFEMSDLFPAMSRAIGITGGNVAVSQRLVKLAADMAGLTPGKTVLDAMEALADAQMGEFERLREFQMKMTQEQMKALGGFEGFLRAAEQRFAGGAAKLARTTVGLVSTITDNIKNLFRAAGTGMLEAIKPRLQKVVDWFGQNERTVTRWRNTLADMGRQAADKILSWLERAFRYLDTHYFSNPEFQRLDLSGKIKFVWDDLKASFDNWWDTGGRDEAVELGKTIGNALLEGISAVLGGLFSWAWETNKQAVTEPSGENVKRALGTDLLLALLFGRFLGPVFRGGKWILGKLLGWGAAAGAGAAAGSATGTGGAAAATAPTLARAVVPRAGAVVSGAASGLGAVMAGSAPAWILPAAILTAAVAVASSLYGGFRRGFKYGDWSYFRYHGEGAPPEPPVDFEFKPSPVTPPARSMAEQAWWRTTYQPIIQVSVDARGADPEEVAEKVAAVVARKVGQVWENSPSLALGR